MPVTDSDLDGMMQHLDEAKAGDDSNETKPCRNCARPPEKRVTTREVVVTGQQSGGASKTQRETARRVCPECGAVLGGI